MDASTPRYDTFVVLVTFVLWWSLDRLLTNLLNKYNAKFRAKSDEHKRMIPIHAIRLLTELLMVCWLLPQFNVILLGDVRYEHVLYARVAALIGCNVYIYELVKRGSAPMITIVHHLLTFAAAVYADYNLTQNPEGPFISVRYLIIVLTFGIGFTWPVDYALMVYKLAVDRKKVILVLEIVTYYTLFVRFIQWSACGAYLGIHHADLTPAQLVVMSLASIVWGLSELYTAKVASSN